MHARLSRLVKDGGVGVEDVVGAVGFEEIVPKVVGMIHRAILVQNLEGFRS